jgi:MSHA biogenesis protein MshQ
MKLKFAWLVLSTMLLGGLAQAATLNFNGGAVAGCTYNSPTSTYTCSALLLPVYNDSVAIASGYTVVVNSAVSLAYNQSLQMSGSARLQTSGSNNLDLSQINPSLLNATGSLAAGGNFLLGAGTFGGAVSANGQASVATGGAITGSVTAASLQTGSSVNIGGTVGVSGTIDLGSSTTITGAVSGASISTNSNVNIGALTVGGTVNLGSNNTINGPVAGSSISTNANVVITGSVNVNGLADLGSGNQIGGSLSAGSVQTNSGTRVGAGITSAGIVDLGSGATVVGSISGTTITSNSSLAVTGNIDASVSFTLPSQSSVTGNITAPTVTLNPAGSTVKGDIAASSSLEVGSGVAITGNISGGSLTLRSANVTVNGNATFTGDVDIGSQGTINGDLSARNVTTHASGDYISGNASVNSIYLDHGATVGKTITCTGAGASNCSCVTKPSSYNYNPTCGAATPSGPDHFQITHNGTALTCQPQTVTVTACANSACTAPHYSAATQVTMSPGGQVATISGSGTASVQQFTAGNATLSASAAGVASASTCVNAAANNTSCTMAFSTQGLTVSVPDHLSMASGVNMVVQALQAQGNNPSCVPLLSNVTVPVAFGCGYTDPSNAAATPVQIQNQSGSYTSVACGAATSNVTLHFDVSGSVSTGFQYPEVGKVGLTASYTGTSAPNTGFTATGSTSFTAAPARIKITVLRVNNTPVMGPGMFANASAPFTVTLSAVNTPGNVTTNFGKESTPENFKPTSSIPATNPYGAITSGLFGPISNGVSTSVSGATGQWSYSDVGYITISSALTNVTSNYMGNPAAGFNTQGTLQVGRFIPDHFDVLLPPKAVAPAAPVWGELPSSQNTGVTMKCSQAGGMNNPCPAPYDVSGSFIYSKQPFYVLIKAYNGAATPALTQNYSSAPPSPATAFAKAITLSAWTAAGGSTAWPAGTLVNANTAPPPPTTPVTFDKGVGMVLAASLPNLAFTSTPTAPSLVYVRAIDADLVTSARSSPATSTEIPLTVVSGRMQLGNNYGSETSSMPMAVQSQYYSAAAGAYVFNAAYTADAQGIGASPGITFTNCKNGQGVAIACPAFTVKSPGSLTFNNGKASFLMAAPNTAVSTDVTLNPASWSNLYLPAVPGRATFGVYRSGPVIYTREVHN